MPLSTLVLRWGDLLYVHYLKEEFQNLGANQALMSFAAPFFVTCQAPNLELYAEDSSPLNLVPGDKQFHVEVYLMYPLQYPLEREDGTIVWVIISGFSFLRPKHSLPDFSRVS